MIHWVMLAPYMLNHQYSLPVNTSYVLEQGMAVTALFEQLSHTNCHSDCLGILLHSYAKSQYHWKKQR